MKDLIYLESNPNFLLHLQTSDYHFYCDIEESDENASVKMFDKTGKLISDNYFAYTELINLLTDRKDEIIYLSKEMLYNMNQIEY